MTFAKEGDYIFDIPDIPSPIGLARSNEASSSAVIARREAPKQSQDIELIASILARYSDSNGNSITVSYKTLPAENWQNIPAMPADEGLLAALRL